MKPRPQLTKKKVKVLPEIMIPLVGHVNELRNQEAIVRAIAEDVKKKHKLRSLDYMVGTMIEIPRAAITANEIAEVAEFFSFGTNDLTQMGFGYSRDDVGGFPAHLPGQRHSARRPVPEAGPGRHRTACRHGRPARPLDTAHGLKCGICGEHGGEPSSVMFCHRVGLNYVSCSPFRVPIARFAAAHAALLTPRKAATKKSCRKK